jgi:hypothetical protein
MYVHVVVAGRAAAGRPVRRARRIGPPDRPRALFVVSFIGPVAPQGGGTLILSGSPRLLIRQEGRKPAGERPGSGEKIWARFHRADPWLMALTGHAPSPADRIAAFMDQETIIGDVPPACGRADRRAGRHGLLPSPHGPLRRPEPGLPAALHADQDAGHYP